MITKQLLLLLPFLVSGCILAIGNDGGYSEHEKGDLVRLEAIHTDDAPAAIGPYSQAVVAGDIVFCSGQIALDPKSGEIVGATAAEQTRQVLQNLAQVAAAAGSSMDQVVRTTIFLADMGDYPSVNEVYAEFFQELKPARACVAVKTLPKNVLVEIDCIATR